MNPQSATDHSGRRSVVLGLGRSGLAAARLLHRLGGAVTVCDSGDSVELRERAEILRGEGIMVITGPEADIDAGRYDLAVLSPGIEETTPLVRNVTDKGIPMIGELELAHSLCRCPVIAITGSNGKTTTTELTTLMLQGAGLKAVSCGNIGTPMSELIGTAESWDVLVAEVSSFQLETIRAFRPKVAVWLNLSPNHLDRYPSMKEYRDAKLRIFKNQRESDIVVMPFGEELPVLKSRTITFSTTDEGADLTLRGSEILHRGKRIMDLTETKLHGAHNAANIMAALGCGIALEQDLSAMIRAIRDYTPPAHRCELIAEHGGVRWINDSKATNLDAMEQAIRSVPAPLILIAGGKDKGFGFAPIAPLVRERVEFAILIGEIRHRIAGEWEGIPSATVDTLEEAVNLASAKAMDKAKASGICATVLLSPGTSSYDMFRDYAERGDTFRKLVNTHDRKQ
jgi:UDP-N-acetylmuramoylalanine--D-glutamate ligase